MHIKHKGVRAVLAVAGMAAAMFATQVAMPGVAQARCIDTNQPETLKLIVDDVTLAQEVPRTNTCQGNRTYTTDFKSLDSDYQASLWWQDDGHWYGVTGGFNTDTVKVEIYDENAHTLIHLCVTDRDSDWKCGVGETYVGDDNVNHLVSVVNDGF